MFRKNNFYEFHGMLLGKCFFLKMVLHHLYYSYFLQLLEIFSLTYQNYF